MTMTESHVPVIASTLQTTHKWLREPELLASLRNESDAWFRSARSTPCPARPVIAR